MDEVKVIKGNGHTLRIWRDMGADSPREWDNAGEMVCFSARRKLGDSHDYMRSVDFLRDVAEPLVPEHVDVENLILYDLERAISMADSVVMLPLYVYEHSGTAISTTPFSCPWDSGHVGWIWAKVGGDAGATKEEVQQRLEAEVRTYDQWLQGDVYWYELTNDETGVVADTCSDCYGFESILSMMPEELTEIREGLKS